MKQFFRKLTLFLIPFPLYIGLVILVDPYNFFNISHLITNETKYATSEKLNPQLWKLIEYKHIKSHKIILGDSRSDKINAEYIQQTTGIDIYNFSYTGGTLIDMIETFWYAAGRQKLDEVYMGINFNLYNDFERNNNVEQAKSILNSLFSYSFSKVVFNSMIQNVKKQYFIRDYVVGIPDMNKEEFWNYQLTVMGKRFYQKYKHPDQYFQQLTEIADYCRKNNIKLVFFMPPTHIELQKRIADFNLKSDYEKFLKDIATLGPCYNFDVTSEYTSNKNNFFDPFHTVNDSLIVHSIWLKNNTLN